MFDSDGQKRVYSLGAGEQLTCYLDANFSACRDMASVVVMALSRCHGVTA